MARRKTKTISVRVNKALYDLLKSVTDELNKQAGTKDFNDRLSVGDTVRSMVQYFIMGFTLGKWGEPLRDLRKDFFGFMKDTVSEKEKLSD